MEAACIRQDRCVRKCRCPRECIAVCLALRHPAFMYPCPLYPHPLACLTHAPNETITNAIPLCVPTINFGRVFRHLLPPAGYLPTLGWCKSVPCSLLPCKRCHSTQRIRCHACRGAVTAALCLSQPCSQHQRLTISGLAMVRSPSINMYLL